uniref:Uncharacterized protein n=1 Tax=Mammaliicoccus phage MSShimriz1 TaxID=3230127 RepID=A0AAU8GVG1_9VIRU
MKFIKLFISNLTKAIKSGIINSIPYIGIYLLAIGIPIAFLAIAIGFMIGVSHLLDYIGLPELSPLSFVTIIGILLGISKAITDEYTSLRPSIKEFMVAIIYMLVIVYISSFVCYVVLTSFKVQEDFILLVILVVFAGTTFILNMLCNVLKKTYKDYKEEK